MTPRRKRRIDVRIDKLTTSIENSRTGKMFETSIVRMRSSGARLLENDNFQFDWSYELHDSDHEVYKLTTREDPSIIQGLISLEVRRDHVFVHLVENAAFNKGRQKLHIGAAGNLIAFACKKSFENGLLGFVAFDSKSSLVSHSESTLGAKRLWGIRMFLDSVAASNLAPRYFKDFYNGTT